MDKSNHNESLLNRQQKKKNITKNLFIKFYFYTKDALKEEKNCLFKVEGYTVMDVLLFNYKVYLHCNVQNAIKTKNLN